jgi:hypothetical protein
MSSSPIIEKSPASPPDLSQTRNSPELNEPDPGTEHEQHDHGVEWAELVRIAFVAIAAAAVSRRQYRPCPGIRLGQRGTSGSRPTRNYLPVRISWKTVHRDRRDDARGRREDKARRSENGAIPRLSSLTAPSWTQHPTLKKRWLDSHALPFLN